jgi:hypothetical protein
VAGIGRVNGRVSGPFGNVGAEFAIGEQSLSVYAVDKQSNPAVLAEMEKYLNSVSADTTASPDLRFSIAYDHRPKAIRAAIYQSALLAMFKHFGYWFLFHDHYRPLCEQVAHPNDDILSSQFKLVDEQTADKLLARQPCAVFFMHERRGIQVLLRMRPKGGQGRSFAVLLPGPESPEVTVPQKQTFRGTVVPFREEWLWRPSNFFFELWHYVQTEQSKGPGAP